MTDSQLFAVLENLFDRVYNKNAEIGEILMEALDELKDTQMGSE